MSSADGAYTPPMAGHRTALARLAPAVDLPQNATASALVAEMISAPAFPPDLSSKLPSYPECNRLYRMLHSSGYVARLLTSVVASAWTIFQIGSKKVLNVVATDGILGSRR